MAPAAQLLALQQHQQNMHQQNLHQQQQQPHHQQAPAAGGLLACCVPSSACVDPQQVPAARKQGNLGRSSAVQDLRQLAGNPAALAGNTAAPPAAAAADDDDVDLYDLGDWEDDELVGDEIASRGSGGSGLAGMDAHYSAMQLNEQPHQQQQQQQRPQQQRPQQQQQQQWQRQGLPRSGRGSASSEVGARRLYQQREPVWYVDPLFHTCFRGSVFGADTAEQGTSSSTISSSPSRYIVDLQCAAVRYVEATAAQLLPRLCVGDWVWCKPSMAHFSQLGAATRLRMQQRQQQHQQLRQQQAGHDPWFSAEWVLGQVLTTELHGCVPVCEVRLPDGDTCWFPNIHLEQVKEVGESSAAAETRRLLQQLATAALEVRPIAPAANTAGVEQQQQQQQSPMLQQQQAEPTTGMQLQQQQQQCAAEVQQPLSNGSRHCQPEAGSTGSVQCPGQASCGAAVAAAAPGSGDAATTAAVADAVGMETDVLAAAGVAGTGGVSVSAQKPDSLMCEAAPVQQGSAAAVPAVAEEEEVADSADLLLLLPPAEGAGDSSEALQGAAAAAAEGKAAAVQGQLPAADVARHHDVIH
jgi:hypothetical protein